MNLTTLINEIGDDADLLTRSDEWLEESRKSTAASLDSIARELQAIQTAQRIKRMLQQQNLVAVQSIIKSTNGDIQDILVRIMSLPDALALLRASRNDTIDELNFAGQIVGWDSDGYDIPASAKLRPSA